MRVGVLRCCRLCVGCGLHGLRAASVLLPRIQHGALLFDVRLLVHFQRDLRMFQLAAHGMLASMSGKGDCYDNAVAESFFATLEFELVMTHDWHTREEARRAIFRYIETWYNRKRRHSTLGYVSPAEYEAQVLKAA